MRSAQPSDFPQGRWLIGRWFCLQSFSRRPLCAGRVYGMQSGELPDNVKGFIAGHIDSAVQLELLLLLHRTRSRTWDAAAIGNELKIDAGWAGSQLANLCRQGLLECGEAPAAVYEYQPRTAELDAAVAALAAAYNDRRVSV